VNVSKKKEKKFSFTLTFSIKHFFFVIKHVRKLGVTTLSKMTSSLMTFSIFKSQHNDIQ